MNQRLINTFLLTLAMSGIFIASCRPEQPQPASAPKVADVPEIDNDWIDAMLLARPAGIVKLPIGKFVMTRSIIVSSYGTTLEGECSASPYPNQAATELVFPENCDGIVIEGRPKGQGERCMVKGICLTSRGGTTGVGIVVRGARAQIINCSANRFAGHGCWIAGSVAEGTNCNLFAVSGSTFASNGGDGLRIEGNNSNVGTVVASSFEANGGWGGIEVGTLGSNWFSCHASGNAKGAYCIGGAKAAGTIFGCYSEGGQPPSWVGQRSIVVGGLHGAGVDGTTRDGVRAGSYVASDSYGLQLPIVQSLIRSGEAPPAIPGVPNQFVPIESRGKKSLGWLCVRPGFWYQRVQ